MAVVVVIVVVVSMVVRHVHPLLDRRQRIWLLDERRAAQVFQLFDRVPAACHAHGGAACLEGGQGLCVVAIDRS
jgi:hypothetical protein